MLFEMKNQNKMVAFLTGLVLMFSVAIPENTFAADNLKICGVDIGITAGTHMQFTTANGTASESGYYYNGTYLAASQCFGFARWVQIKLFGQSDYNGSYYSVSVNGTTSIAAGSLNESNLKSFITAAKPGAHLRTYQNSSGNAHSMVITEITDSGFSIAQANGSNNNEYSGYKQNYVGTYTYTWSSYVNSTYGKRGINYIKLPYDYPYPDDKTETAIDFPIDGDNITADTFRIQGWVLSSDVSRATFSVNGGEEHELNVYWRDDVGGKGFLADLLSYKYLGYGDNSIKINAYLTDGTVIDVGTRNVVRYGAFALDTPERNSEITGDQFDIRGWIQFSYADWDIARMTVLFENGEEKELNLYTRPDVPNATAYLGTFYSGSTLKPGNNYLKMYVYYTNGVCHSVDEFNLRYTIQSALDLPQNGQEVISDKFQIIGWVKSSNVSKVTCSINGKEEISMSTYWRSDVEATGFQADLRSYQFLDAYNNDVKVKAYLNSGNVIEFDTRSIYRNAGAALDRPSEDSVVQSDTFDLSGWVYNGYDGQEIDHVNVIFNEGNELPLNMYKREDVSFANAFLGNFNTLNNLKYGQNTILLKVYYKNGSSSDMIKRRINSDVLKVSFNADCEELSYSDKGVIYRSVYGDLPVATREGYTFDGWYTEENGGELITSNSIVNTQNDITLYAHWTFNATPEPTVTAEPTAKPTVTAEPTAAPTVTAEPTAAPTLTPTLEPGIQTGGITVSAVNVNSRAGDTIKVPITIENNDGFSSLGIEIDYDDSVMELIDAESAGVGASFTTAQYITAKPYNMQWDSASNVDFNGEIAVLTFKVKDDAPDGTYPITIQSYKGKEGDYIDGEDVNYDEDFKPLVLAYIDGDVTVSSHIPGDITGDMRVNNKDATYLLRHLAGWEISDIDMSALDVDGNGKVNNKDATTLLRYLAGWEVKLY